MLIHFKQYIFFLVSIGILVFFPVLFNSFALDDYHQIVKNSFIHSPQHIPLFFITSLGSPQKTGGYLDFYYRPLPLVFFALLYSLGHGHALLLHVLQVSLYIANSILVFIFFRKIFKERLAFFLTLIFLISPVNESIAAYISDLQENLFFFFGICSLVILMNKTIVSTKKFFLCILLICFSLLAKETGILFIIMTSIYNAFFQKTALKRYLYCVAIALGIYACMRMEASFHHFMYLNNVDTFKTSFHDRIAIVPQLLAFYLQVLISPNIPVPSVASLQHASLWIRVTSWIMIIGFCISMIDFGFYVWMRKKQYRKYYLFFCIWFVLGILFHIQLFALDTTAAKRWLYFSTVGGLGMIGVVIQTITIKNKKILILCWILLIAIICLYILTTMRLNFLWREWYKYL